MLTVSNAGPLISLSKLGQLGLLLKLCGKVIIPREVYNEAVVNGIKLGAPDFFSIKRIIDADRILVEDVILSDQDCKLIGTIDLGEVEVITLAKQKNADWVLIDNQHARKVARLQSLKVKGTVGILVDGFRKSFLSTDEVQLIIEEIKVRPDLWISDRLCDYALQMIRGQKVI